MRCGRMKIRTTSTPISRDDSPSTMASCRTSISHRDPSGRRRDGGERNHRRLRTVAVARKNIEVDALADREEMNMQTEQMLSTHPNVRGDLSQPLVRCIEECYDCALTCASCADACLAEQAVAQLRQCIRLDLDCADVCIATGALAIRRTGSNEDILRQLLRVCLSACS